MKYITVARVSLLLTTAAFFLSVISMFVWRYEPWSFKWNYDIGSAVLVSSIILFVCSWSLLFYKLNHEHYEVDKE